MMGIYIENKKKELFEIFLFILWDYNNKYFNIKNIYFLKNKLKYYY